MNQLQEDEKPSVALFTEWNTELRNKPEDVGAREWAAVKWADRDCLVEWSWSWKPEQGEVRESAETPVRAVLSYSSIQVTKYILILKQKHSLLFRNGFWCMQGYLDGKLSYENSPQIVPSSEMKKTFRCFEYRQ